jgi:hypothetical protein
MPMATTATTRASARSTSRVLNSFRFRSFIDSILHPRGSHKTPRPLRGHWLWPEDGGWRWLAQLRPSKTSFREPSKIVSCFLLKQSTQNNCSCPKVRRGAHWLTFNLDPLSAAWTALLLPGALRTKPISAAVTGSQFDLTIGVVAANQEYDSNLRTSRRNLWRTSIMPPG